MKGVSELVAAVIMITIAIAIGTAMASWFFTAATTTTQDIRTEDTVKCSPTSAAIKIRSVFAAAGPNTTLRVMVENSGFSDNMTIKSAIAYNATGHSFAAANIPISGLDRGKSAIIIFPGMGMDLCPYSFDRVVVTTTCAGIFDSFDGQPLCSL